MARRSKLTPAVQKKIVKAIKLGATYAIACAYAGIGVSTFYAWMGAGRAGRSQSKREFQEAIDAAVGAHAVQTLSNIQIAAKKGDVRAALFMLERRHGYTRDGSAARQPEPKTSAVELTPLEQLEKARKEAFASGSFVAGSTLLKEEARCRAERKQAEREREAAEALGETDAHVFEEILSDIRQLPPAAQTRIGRLLLRPAELVTDDD